MRVQVSCINWTHPTAPHAAVWVKNAPLERGGMSEYFGTYGEAIQYADKLAIRLYNLSKED